MNLLDMRIIPFLIFVVLFGPTPKLVSAQSTLSGTCLDSDTKEPIPYVNIGIKDQSKGTVSDFDGNFSLMNIDPNWIIVFSTIGYETVQFSGSAFPKEGLISMKSKDYTFDQIEIEASRFDSEERIFGVRNETRGHSIGFGGTQLGTEIGAPIRIDKPTYIKSANFVLNHAKGDSLLFRINIYQLTDEEIGENKLRENILIKQEQRKGTITIDLTPYELILESDVLLSLEWIRNYDEVGNKGITFDTKKGKKLTGTYLRIASGADYKKFKFKTKYSPCFYFVGIQSQ